MDYIEATQAIPLSDDDETDEDVGENGPEKKLRGHLKVLSKPGFNETQFPIYEGTNIIGRQEGCDIHLPLKALSKEHACIEVMSGSHIIYDKGSRNKTRRLKLFLTPEVRYELRDGDNLIFGDVKCTYTFALPPKPEEDTGSETGSESMLEDPQEKAPVGMSDEDPSEPSSDLIEPSQSRLSPKSKPKMVPMLYATDSEDDDLSDSAISQPFVSVVKETPKQDEDGTVAIADSDDDSFVGRRHDNVTATLVFEDSTVVLDDSTLVVAADDTGQTTVVAETQVYDMDNEEDLAPTQAYSLKPEEETVEDKPATKTGKGKPGTKDPPKSTQKSPQVVDQTVAYTLEAADDAEADQNVKRGSRAKGKHAENAADQTVAYTMDVGEMADKGKQAVSETVAYNMDVDKDETSQDTTDGKEPEETQSFTADEAEETKAPLLFLGRSSTLAFDDDTDTDTELSGTKSAPRQDNGTFIVGDDGEYDVPTQVFPDEQCETQVLLGDDTQVFDDMKEQGTEEEATQVLPLDEPSMSNATAKHEGNDEMQVFDETVQIPCGDETQVFDSPKRNRVKNQMDDTQVMSDSDIPTVFVKKSPSPKKKVQWAMEATQMFTDEDGTDVDSEASPSFATPADRRPKAARALMKCPLDDTQVLEDSADGNCPVLFLETTPDGRPNAKSKPSPAVNLEATQLLGDDFDATQMLNETCPTLQVDETPFRKPKAKPACSTNMDATQVLHDVSNEFDATQMLDETCPTLQVDETPFCKPRTKSTRTSDLEATQVIGDVSADFDATQMLDETCPTLQVDETPFCKPRTKSTRTSDLEATQVIGDVSADFDATQMLDETCPTLQVDETPFRKPAAKSSRTSDMAAATQVFSSDCNATQMFDETCPTLDVDEEPSPCTNQRSANVDSPLEATQVFGGDETHMLSDDEIEGVSMDCPTLEIDDTPVRKAVKKPARGSDMFAATQMFNDDDDDDGDLPDLDDTCPTIEVSDLQTPIRPGHVHSPFAATQVLGGDETQVLGSDDEATQELDEPEEALVESPVRRRKPSQAPPAKASMEPAQHTKSDDETQPLDGVEDDPVDTATPTADTFVHPDDIATQAYGATSNDDDETQSMDGVDDNPVDTAAPRADTFVHPDDIATQAYGATSDDDDDGNESEEIDFGLPIPILPSPRRPIKETDAKFQPPHETAASATDNNKRKKQPVQKEVPAENAETKDDDMDDNTEDMSEEVPTVPGDEEATQAYALFEENEEEEEEEEEEVEPNEHPAAESRSAKSSPHPSAADASVILLTETPSPRKRGRPKKSVPAKSAIGDPSVADESVILLTEAPSPRKQGRPTKSALTKSAVVEPSGADESVILLTDTPSPRKRGRPTKSAPAKTAVVEPSGADESVILITDTPVPRQRGRQKKSAQADKTSTEHSADWEGRQRGPIIKEKPEDAKPSTVSRLENPVDASEFESSQLTTTGKRGRPRKTIANDEANNAAEASSQPKTLAVGETAPVKPSPPEKRGRPRKSVAPTEAEGSDSTVNVEPNAAAAVHKPEPSQPGTPGKRGRPRKSLAVAEASNTDDAKTVTETDSVTSNENVSDQVPAAVKRGRQRKSVISDGVESTKAVAGSDSGTKLKPKKNQPDPQSDNSEILNADKATLEVPAKRGRGRKSRAQGNATAQEKSPIQSSTEKGKPEERGKPNTAGSQTTEDSESTVDDSQSQRSVPPRRGRDSAANTKGTDNPTSKDSQETDSQGTESQQSVPLIKETSKGKHNTRGKRKSNEVDFQSTTDDTKGAASQQSLPPTTGTSSQVKHNTRGKRKSNESDTQSTTEGSQNTQTTGESQSQQSSQTSTRGRRSKVDNEAVQTENKRSSRRSNAQSEPEPSTSVKQKSATQSKGNTKKVVGEVADVAEVANVKESNTGTRGSRSRHTKMAVIEEDDAASGKQATTSNNLQQTKRKTVKEADDAEKSNNTQRGRRRTVQITPDEKLDIDVTKKAEDTESVASVDSTAEKTRQSRRRTVVSITAVPAQPVQNRRRGRKNEDAVSVASEDGDMSGSQDRSTRGRRQSVIEEPMPETSTKEAKESDKKTSVKTVRGRGRKSTAPHPTITGDPVKEEDEAPEPKSRRGKGRLSVVAPLRDPTPEKSTSPQHRGRSKGRREVKPESVAPDIDSVNPEPEDDFKAVSSGKRAMKRQASTESVASNPVTKKQRGGKVKVERTESPARSQQNQSQPSTPGTPSLRHRTEKPKIMFTGVVDDKGQKARVRTIKDLGGELADNIFDCTHLVTDKVRRTVKFLCGIARGLPIVSVKWLNACREAKIFVDVTPHLVKDPESEKTHKFKLEKSIAVAAERPLLQGYKIHVTKSVKPDPKQMKDIITCAGGEFLSAMPRKLDKGVMIVSCEDDKDFVQAALVADIPIVSAEFLLTGVLRQEADIQTYWLFSATATGPSQPKKRRK